MASGPSCQMALGLQECDLRKKATESEGMFFWHPVFFGKGTGWLTKDLHVPNGLDYWISSFFGFRLRVCCCWIAGEAGKFDA